MSDATVPDHLTLENPAPTWFDRALAQPLSSHFVNVDGGPVHYLRWEGASARADTRGLLFVHGGGAHAQWWRFIAPFFTRDFRCAALDLSGMGDSAPRTEYSTDGRTQELRAVIEDAGLGRAPFVIGHSMGGFITMRLGASFGHELGGAVIVDSPIRDPEEGPPLVPPPPSPKLKTYPSLAAALERFRLLPQQRCDNAYIVEFIARHSLRRVEGGWTWKFDPASMGPRQFGQPFHEHLQAVSCRAALIFGEHSALVTRSTATYMSALMGPRAPVVEIPDAHHHVMLDQPLAFVAAVRTLLDGWVRAEDA